jgi:predicted ATP-grasp superfamily ATP-dependent carboligase
MRTEKRKHTVLVTDADRGSAVAVLRSLGRAGYRVLAADSAPGSLGFRSRYATRSFVVPSPREAPRDWTDAIEAIVIAEGVDLVIPVTDLAIQPLAAARQRFAGKTLVAMPDDGALKMVTDKSRTLELAAALGIPVPPTRRVRTVEAALAAARDWGWPLVLKPQASHRLEGGCDPTAERGRIESFQVSYAENATDLQRRFGALQGRCDVLLQRFYAGAGVGIELLASRGRALMAFAHRRRREIPLSGGASSYRESVRLVPQLLDWSMRLLGKLEWTGLAMVEFKMGAAGAELMEINGRIWGSLPLAVASGVDFPASLARLYLHGEDSIVPRLTDSYRLGLRCRDLHKDLLWIGTVLSRQRRYGFVTMPSRARALRACLGMLNPARKLDLLTWDDPLPGLCDLPRLGPRLWAKLRQAQAGNDTTVGA